MCVEGMIDEVLCQLRGRKDIFLTANWMAFKLEPRRTVPGLFSSAELIMEWVKGMLVNQKGIGKWTSARLYIDAICYGFGKEVMVCSEDSIVSDKGTDVLTF